MIEYLELGPVPSDEQCEQLGPNYNPAKARAESRIYAAQLARMFDSKLAENSRGWFSVKSFPHEFGNYLEVVVKYDPNDELSVAWAFDVENNLPENWDKQALLELENWPCHCIGNVF